VSLGGINVWRARCVDFVRDGCDHLRSTQGKIGAFGAPMAEAGEAPGLEQVAEMERLQAYLMNNYCIDFVLLVVAVVAMAVARYL